MSIHLCVDEYCQNCKWFEAEVKKATLTCEDIIGNGYDLVETTVFCRHQELCKNIVKNLKKEGLVPRSKNDRFWGQKSLAISVATFIFLATFVAKLRGKNWKININLTIKVAIWPLFAHFWPKKWPRKSAKNGQKSAKNGPKWAILGQKLHIFCTFLIFWPNGHFFFYSGENL